MLTDSVKPPPASSSDLPPKRNYCQPAPVQGYRWKYRQPTCKHGFVLGKGLCPHIGCPGARRRRTLLHYRTSYLKPKDMTAGATPGLYRCYMCGRKLSDGTMPERYGPSQFFGASSKRNGHQSRCKQCDNRRRRWRRCLGTAQGGTR